MLYCVKVAYMHQMLKTYNINIRIFLKVFYGPDSGP